MYMKKPETYKTSFRFYEHKKKNEELANRSPFSIARTSLTTKYIIVTDWSGSPNKAEMNILNSGALLSSKYRPWLEQK